MMTTPDPPSDGEPKSPDAGASQPPASPEKAPPVPRAGAAASGAGRKAKLRDDDGRLVRGRKSRVRIREAARQLFRERGFDGATLRAIAERAGMGASSIYRHVQSKEELLMDELSELQEEAWRRFRAQDDRAASTRQRVGRFLDAQHELLAADRDFSLIALRAATRPEARVARRVLLLNDRSIGLIAEILQMGRKRRDIVPDLNVLEAASTIFHVTQGARLPWVNGLVSADACRRSIQAGIDLLFVGIEVEAPAPAPGEE
jgi:AcrR family transcriptional regulator